MKIIGIETSCDETAISVIEIEDGSIKVLSNSISSQVKLHAKFGGVVPNLAAREHVKNLEKVFKLSLKQSKININDIGLIAVTRGPGLGPALLVGIAFAKTLAWKYDKPLIGVNHLEGHIYSNWLPITVNSKSQSPNSKRNSKPGIMDSKLFPILNLIVSGGHTELVLMSAPTGRDLASGGEDFGKYRIIGETLDDAVGEAFDKVARLLGLGYPGGPIISKLAEEGDPEHYPLPSPMIHLKNYDFSYSGLKTAVLYLLRDLNLKKIDEQTKADIASSFQKAAFKVLLEKTVRAAKEYNVRSIFLSGGVSANKYLRRELEKAARELKVNYSQPELEYTGDNAAMIAAAGYINYIKIKNSKLKIPGWKSVEMDANLGF
jgi:N6-L-threonylcarbamoyladenine synthase